MKPFKQLSFHDNKTLLNLPAYIALLAANADGKLDEDEKLASIEYAHIKTFSFDPLLDTFYKEVDRIFEITLMQLNKQLPKGKKNREIAIKNELSDIKKIVSKLDSKQVSVIHHNMNALIEHVSRAHHNVLIDFIFPIPMPGIVL
jgi:hypothetical protein